MSPEVLAFQVQEELEGEASAPDCHDFPCSPRSCSLLLEVLRAAGETTRAATKTERSKHRTTKRFSSQMEIGCLHFFMLFLGRNPLFSYFGCHNCSFFLFVKHPAEVMAGHPKETTAIFKDRGRWSSGDI